MSEKNLEESTQIKIALHRRNLVNDDLVGLPIHDGSIGCEIKFILLMTMREDYCSCSRLCRKHIVWLNLSIDVLHFWSAMDIWAQRRSHESWAITASSRQIIIIELKAVHWPLNAQCATPKLAVSFCGDRPRSWFDFLFSMYTAISLIINSVTAGRQIVTAFNILLWIYFSG